jgi:hypothetical protein
MRVPLLPEDLHPAMGDAWHVDLHRGSMSVLLDPAGLVSAVFKIPRCELRVGAPVSTPFGKFFVDELATKAEDCRVLLHTRAPGLISRFEIRARQVSPSSCEVSLLNSVHPTSRLGRVYFRLIEFGHHVAMEVALARLAKVARGSRGEAGRVG